MLQLKELEESSQAGGWVPQWAYSHLTGNRSLLLSSQPVFCYRAQAAMCPLLGRESCAPPCPMLLL